MVIDIQSAVSHEGVLRIKIAVRYHKRIILVYIFQQPDDVFFGSI